MRSIGNFYMVIGFISISTLFNKNTESNVSLSKFEQIFTSVKYYSIKNYNHHALLLRVRHSLRHTYIVIVLILMIKTV